MTRTLLALAACVLLTAGCGSSSPTSPTPGNNLPTQPFSLTVRTRTAPPAHKPIPGTWYPYVALQVIDTPSTAWRTEWLTSDRTSMQLVNLVGEARIRVGAVPSTSSSEVEIVETTVLMDDNKEIEVLLRPKREQRTLPVATNLVSACPAGWSTRAVCTAYALPVYHDGTVAANINWKAAPSGLTFELWREDDERLAVSVSGGTRQQQISATTVTGGHVYYLRILYDYNKLEYTGTINATS